MAPKPKQKTKKGYIEVTARYLAMLAPFCSKTRYHLQGVFVEPHPHGGALLVATDGHRMVVVYDKQADATRSDIFPICNDARKFLDDAETPPNLIATFCENRVEFSDNTGIRAIYLSEPIDGSHPNWRKVFYGLAPEKNARWAFNPEYLESFRAINHRVQISHTGPNSPAVFTFPEDREVVGLLMPMAMGPETGSLLPDWLNVKQPEPTP